MQRTNTAKSLLRPKSSRKSEHIQSNKNKSKKPVCMGDQLDINSIHQLTKINLANRNIEVLDNIANKLSRSSSVICSQIKTLYLSNNLISSIQYIGQFPCLQILSLSNNQIHKLAALHPLSNLVMLSHVSVNGNPVCDSTFYLPCIISETVNAKIKVIDNITITSIIVEQSLANWQAYSHNIQELTYNYVKLMYLAQHCKKHNFHTVIKKATALLLHQSANSLHDIDQQVQPQFQQQQAKHQRLNFGLRFMMKQAQTDMQYLPSYFIKTIQQSLYQDVCRIASKRSEISRYKLPIQSKDSSQNQFIFIMQEEDDIMQVNKNMHNAFRLENIGTQRESRVQEQLLAMQQLMRKQQDKIIQISDKFIKREQKYNNTYNNDIKIAQQLIESVLNQNQQSPATQYYNWKLLSKIINGLKIHSASSNRIKYGIATIVRVVNTYTIQHMMDGLQNIKKQAKKYPIRKIVDIFNYKLQENYRISLQTLRNYVLQQQRMQIIKQQQHMKKIQQNSVKQAILTKYINKTQQTICIKDCLHRWRSISNHQRLIKQNAVLNSKMQQYKIRESKLINKVCLLEKLLAVTEQKLKAKQQTDPKKLLSLISKQCETLGYNNYTNISSATTTRSPSISSRCESPRIRKNKVKQGKQNMDNNQQILKQLIKKSQRVFNSSKKQLRI